MFINVHNLQDRINDLNVRQIVHLSVSAGWAALLVTLGAYATAWGQTGALGEIRFKAAVHSAPGIKSEVVRKTTPGEVISIMGMDESGRWYQLGEDEWVAALLVDVLTNTVPVINHAASTETAAMTRTSPLTVGSMIRNFTPPTSTSEQRGIQRATVNRTANLRQGPGVEFDVAGTAEAGQTVEIQQRSDDGSWVRLSDDQWIASFLIEATEQITALPVLNTSTGVSVTSSNSVSSLANPPEPLSLTPFTMYATRNANLRDGPSTDFAVSGGVSTADEVTVTGQNGDGSWYYLDSDQWIAAFLVSESPPEAQATTQVERTETEPAAKSEGKFVVAKKRLWDVSENGGYLDGTSVHCGYKRELFVHVLDRNGNRMNGAAVQVVYGAKEIEVTGSQGIGDGIASFVLGKGQDVKVVRAPDGSSVDSEIARGLVTESQYIAHDMLMAARYCHDDASCKQFVDGNGCYGHFSWEVFFQQQ